MPSQRVQDRRRHRRYPVNLTLRAKQLLALGLPGRRIRDFHAEVLDISSGGLRIFTRRQLEVFSPLRGEVVFKEVPVPIPVVLQVRWSQKIPRRRGYQAGLQFIV